MEDLLKIIENKNEFYKEKLKKEEGYKDRPNNVLLVPTLKYGIITQIKGLTYIEDAVRYVKLLFIASQKGRLSERIELLNLSSPRYLLLRETENTNEASLSLFVSDLARTLVEKIS
jgi:hypothetical protein